MEGCLITRRQDLPDVARCHVRAFPDALASLQGLRFTRKMLEWYVVADRGVLFHVAENGRIIGYCGAIRTPQPGMPGAFTSISQYAFRDFVAGYLRRPWLLFHKENVAKRSGIARNILLRAGVRRPSAPASSVTRAFEPYWGLVVIGVDPNSRGKGVGRLLMHRFEELARRDGAQLVQLTVKSTNRSALALYLSLGWSIVNGTKSDLLLQKRL